jgi:hypothetical protein
VPKLRKAAASLLLKAVSSSLEKARRLLLVFVAGPVLRRKVVANMPRPCVAARTFL